MCLNGEDFEIFFNYKNQIHGFYIQIVFCVPKNALFQRKIKLILFLGDLGEHWMRMRNFGESIFLFLGEWGMKIT
jgi:hypothetical protein